MRFCFAVDGQMRTLAMTGGKIRRKKEKKKREKEKKDNRSNGNSRDNGDN